MIMRPDGSDQRELESGSSTFVPPRWSPDGKWILYGGQSGLHTIRPDGADDRLVLPASVIDVWSASWSPDGRRLVVEPSVGAPSTDGLWVINMADHSKTRIFTNRAERPAWSPTSDLIAFAGGPDRAVYTVRPDGTGLTQLTTFGQSIDNSTWNSNLAWTTDGTRLLFTHGQSTERIWTMNRDGTDMRTIVDVGSRD